MRSAGAKTRGEDFLTTAAPPLMPFIIWALYFAAVYGIATLGCTAGPAATYGPVAYLWVQPVLWTASIVATVCVIALVGRACLLWRRAQSPKPLAMIVRIGAAVLALVAVLWTGVLTLVPSLCAAI